MSPSLKLLIVHRRYRDRGGEDVFLDKILIPSLKKLNVNYQTLILPRLRSTELLEIFGMITGLEKIRPSYSRCLSAAREGSITHVIFNNFIPTSSLIVPKALRAQGIKTFYWAHNFRLDCANGLHFNGKNICTRCIDNGSRWSFIQNCQRNWLQSLLYAVTYRQRRITKTFSPYIDHFICNSNFTKRGITSALEKIGRSASTSVLPMPVPREKRNKLPEPARLMNLLKQVPKPFYLFLGRLSYDKGADIVLQLAQKFPEKGFIVCGEGPLRSKLEAQKNSNLIIADKVNEDEKPWLFENCEALIIPSRTPETASLVITESHPYGTPVVYPLGGGAEETFLRLKRLGCPLQDFAGQNFTRSHEFKSDESFEQFESSLMSLLSSVT